MEPARLTDEPDWEPVNLDQPGLFRRMKLAPGRSYELDDAELPGAIGITHDRNGPDCSHVYVRLFQGVARVFNRKYRSTDHHLVHGFGVLGRLENPVNGQEWLVGHSTWEGGITSRRAINHLAPNDQGTRVWVCTHAGVRFWTKRVFELMCFRRGHEVPDNLQRPKFSLYAGITLPFRRPQMKRHNDTTIGRLACAVADVIHGDQIRTQSGGHVRHFTCLGMVSFAVQSAVIINLLAPGERREIESIQDRAERVDRLKGLMRSESHPIGKFMNHDPLGLQNARFAWPSVFARAMDYHSVHVEPPSEETPLLRQKE